MEKLLVYEVIIPIKDYGFNLKVGDKISSKELFSIPPYYRKCVKLMKEPIKIK